MACHRGRLPARLTAKRAHGGGGRDAIGYAHCQGDLQEQRSRKLSGEQCIAMIDGGENRANHDRVSASAPHDRGLQGQGEK